MFPVAWLERVFAPSSETQRVPNRSFAPLALPKRRQEGGMGLWDRRYDPGL